jgi:hypothetical protein
VENLRPLATTLGKQNCMYGEEHIKFMECLSLFDPEYAALQFAV